MGTGFRPLRPQADARGGQWATRPADDRSRARTELRGAAGVPRPPGTLHARAPRRGAAVRCGGVRAPPWEPGDGLLRCRADRGRPRRSCRCRAADGHHKLAGCTRSVGRAASGRGRGHAPFAPRAAAARAKRASLARRARTAHEPAAAAGDRGGMRVRLHVRRHLLLRDLPPRGGAVRLRDGRLERRLPPLAARGARPLRRPPGRACRLAAARAGRPRWPQPGS